MKAQLIKTYIRQVTTHGDENMALATKKLKWNAFEINFFMIISLKFKTKKMMLNSVLSKIYKLSKLLFQYRRYIKNYTQGKSLFKNLKKNN